MIRTTLLLTIFLLSLQAYAQETVQIKDMPKKTAKGEIYHVLKSDRSIKHGPYELYNWGNLKESGQYKHGLKDGIWKVYDYGGNISAKYTYDDGRLSGPFEEYYGGKKNTLKAQGYFTDSKHSGIWKFLNNDGSLHMSFNFDTREVLKYEVERSGGNEWKILVGTDTVSTTLDFDPFLIGNENTLMVFIAKNIRYPEVALENGIEGTVVIGFTINADGTCSDLRILKDIGGGCAAEAMRVIKKTDGFWVPGELNGAPVTTPMLAPVKFKMGK